MNRYTLYLDETKLWNKNHDQPNVYGIAGVVISEEKKLEINNKLTDFKKGLFKNPEVILHETDIRQAGKNNKKIINEIPEYSLLTRRKNMKLVFNQIGDIINNYCYVLGTIIDVTSLNKNYRIKESTYTSYYLGMKTIMENYTKFLYDHNATGNIILESRKTTNNQKLDSRIRKQYYKIMCHGTYRYSALYLQNKLTGISFVEKMSNDNLLQIADFIPRPLLLHYVKVGQKKSNPSIYQKIRCKRYDGGAVYNGAGKYGVVLIN